MGTDTAYWQTILSNGARHLHARQALSSSTGGSSCAPKEPAAPGTARRLPPRLKATGALAAVAQPRTRHGPANAGLRLAPGRGPRTNRQRSSGVAALGCARDHLQQPVPGGHLLPGRPGCTASPHPRQRHLQMGFEIGGTSTACAPVSPACARRHRARRQTGRRGGEGMQSHAAHWPPRSATLVHPNQLSEQSCSADGLAGHTGCQGRTMRVQGTQRERAYCSLNWRQNYGSDRLPPSKRHGTSRRGAALDLPCRAAQALRGTRCCCSGKPRPTETTAALRCLRHTCSGCPACSSR